MMALAHINSSALSPLLDRIGGLSALTAHNLVLFMLSQFAHIMLIFRRSGLPALRATPCICNTMHRERGTKWPVPRNWRKVPTDSGIREPKKAQIGDPRGHHSQDVARQQPSTSKTVGTYAPVACAPIEDGPIFHPISDRFDAGQCRSKAARITSDWPLTAWHPTTPLSPPPSPPWRTLFPKTPCKHHSMSAHEPFLLSPIRLLRRANRDIPGCH